MTKTIHSGGAKGADTFFGELGARFGYQVLHHSFQGHKPTQKAHKTGQVIIHAQDDLNIKKDILEKARQHLGRQAPKNQFIENLLLRNGYQVQDSQLVVAVSKVNNFKRCHVAGGTGYAVSMAYLASKPILVLDQEREEWFYSTKGSGLFALERQPDVSRFPERFAGIGTRELNNVAMAEITQMFELAHCKGEPEEECGLRM